MNRSNNYTILTQDELVLINILNTMYNDNYRQIEQLQEINSRITDSIINILSNVLTSRARHRNGANTNANSTRNGNINQSRRTQQTSTNSTTNSTTNSLINFLNNSLLGNTPYMVDNIEYLPLQTSSRIDTNTNLNSDINNLIQRFFEPIEVYPTQTQIEIATRIARFSDILNPTNSSCPISMERFNDNDNVSIIRHCGHIFSTQELNVWFRNNCRCPVCRYDIRNYNPSSNANRTTQERNNSHYDASYNHVDISNNNVSNVSLPVPIRDISGNNLNLNVNDIPNLLFNYYTRGARNN
jgi:hypothetical protein